MAQYLLVDDDRRITHVAYAKSIADAVSEVIGDESESDGLSFDVFRVAAGPKRVTIESETVRKVVIK